MSADERKVPGETRDGEEDEPTQLFQTSGRSAAPGTNDPAATLSELLPSLPAPPATRVDRSAPRTFPTLTPRAPDKKSDDSPQEAVLRQIGKRHRPTKKGLSSGAGDALGLRLLIHLAREKQEGPQLSAILGRAAALEERSGQGAVAMALKETALSAGQSSSDVVALRESRRIALQLGDSAAALRMVDRELSLVEGGVARQALRALREELLLDSPLPAEAPTDASLAESLQHAAGLARRGAPGAPQAWLAAAAKASGLLQTSLYVAAGQALERVQEFELCLQAFEDSIEGAPSHLGLRLAAARAARRARRFDRVEYHLRCALDTGLPAALADGLRRLLTQTQVDFADPTQPVEPSWLGDGRLSQTRLSFRACAQRGDEEGVAKTLSRWAELSGGRRAVVPLCLLALLRLKQGDLEAAHQALEEAATLDSQAVEELGFIVDEVGHFVRSPGSHEDTGADAFITAARATVNRAYARESGLLAALSTRFDDATSEALGHDVAMGDAQTRTASVILWSDRLGGADALWPMLALISLTQREAQRPLLEALSRRFPHHPALWAVTLHERGIRGLSEAIDGLPGRPLSPLRVMLSRLRRRPAAASDTATSSAMLIEQAKAQPDSAASFDLLFGAIRRNDADGIELVENLFASRARDPIEQAAHLVSAGTAVARRESQRASAYLQRAAQVAPQDPVLELLSRRAAPVMAFEARVASADAEAGLAQATALEWSGLFDDANSLYRNLLDTPQLAHVARRGLLRCALRRGDFDGAQELYREAQHHAHGREHALAMLAEYQDRLALSPGSPDVDASLNDVGCCPQHVPSLRALERAASRLGRPDELRQAARALFLGLSDRADRTAYFLLWTRLGSDAVMADELDHALVAHGERLDLSHPSLMLAAERAARKLKHSDLLQRSLMGQLASLSDDNERASAALAVKRALLFPRTPPEERSGVEVAKELKQAAALLERHVDGAPSHPTLAEELALVQLLLGRRSQGAEALVKAATAANELGRRASFIYHAARLFEFLGAGDRAEELFTQVLELDEHHQDALERLEVLLRSRRNLPALAALYARKIRREDDPLQRLLLGLERHGFYLALGETAVAEHLLDELLQGHPDPKGTLIRVARDLRASGRNRVAVSVLIALAGRAEEADVQRHAFFSLGEIYLDELSDLRRAEVAFTRCLRLDPDDVAALDRLCQLYTESGRHDQELKALRRLLSLAKSSDERERYRHRIDTLERRLRK